MKPTKPLRTWKKQIVVQNKRNQEEKSNLQGLPLKKAALVTRSEAGVPVAEPLTTIAQPTMSTSAKGSTASASLKIAPIGPSKKRRKTKKIKHYGKSRGSRESTFTRFMKEAR